MAQGNLRVRRLASDKIQLWVDDSYDDGYYLVVERKVEWEVKRYPQRVTLLRLFLRRHFDFGELLGSFSTADEAVAFAKEYLDSGQAELNNALDDLEE